MSQLAIKLRPLVDSSAYLISTTPFAEIDDLPPYTWQILKKAAKTEWNLTPGGDKKELPQDGEVHWNLSKHLLTLRWKECHFKQHLSPLLQGAILKIELDHDEMIYGLGQSPHQFGEGNFELTLHDETYPLFISSKGYMILVLNASKAKATLNRAERAFQINFLESSVHFLFIKGQHPKDLFKQYTEITGNAPLLPKWAFGLWQTSFPAEAQHKVLERLNKHREHQLPLQAIVLDYHWEKSFHDFNWRRELYPAPEEMIQQLKQNQVELAITTSPYINSPQHSWASFVFSAFTGFIPKILNRFKIFHDSDLYRHGKKNGYFVHPKISWWLGKAGAIDFTHKMATEWWFSRQKNLLESGIRFIKNDAGEHLPFKAKASNGLKGSELHNIYAFYYAKETFNFLKNYFGDKKRPFIFSRTSWAGSHRYPGIFLVGPKTNISTGLSLATSGHAYWGADALGISGHVKEEELIRKIQWTLLTPLAHYSSGAKYGRQEPWSLGEKVLEQFRKYTQLRLSLLPLYYTQAKETEKNGVPFMRPLFLEHPQDVKAALIWDQILLGPSLMICPPMTPKILDRKIYLPAGSWFDYWSGQHYLGPCELNYSLTSELPLFFEESSLLIQKVGDDLSFDHLQIELLPLANEKAQGFVYDDAGEGQMYLKDEAELQRFELNYEPNEGKGHLLIHAIETSFPGASSERTFTLSWKFFKTQIEVQFQEQTSQLSQGENFTLKLSKNQSHRVDFKKASLSL